MDTEFDWRDGNGESTVISQTVGAEVERVISAYERQTPVDDATASAGNLQPMRDPYRKMVMVPATVPGDRISIDGVACIVTDVHHFTNGCPLAITTRPVGDTVTAVDQPVIAQRGGPASKAAIEAAAWAMGTLDGDSGPYWRKQATRAVEAAWGAWAAEARICAEAAPTVTCVALCTGQRLAIDGVPCVVTSVAIDGITTRPVTEAD